MADPGAVLPPSGPVATWLRDLLSGNEQRVNAVIFAGLASLFVLFFATIYCLILAPSTFGPMPFATAAGTLVAAIGGGKGLHDFMQRDQPPGGQ